MPLTFQNSCSFTVYLAILTPDSSCGPTDQWRKSGWYAIGAGSSLQIIGVDLRTINQLMAWYADQYANNGGATWAGTGNNWYWVTNNGFNQCYDDNTGCNVQYDFQPLDFNNSYGVIVTLGPESGQVNVTGYGPPPPPPPPPHSDHSDGWGGGGGFGDGFADGFSDGFGDGGC